MMRWAIPFVVIAFGLGLLSATTDRFQAFTTEGARRLQISQQPRPVPAVAMTDMSGRERSLADYKGRIILVDFIYTWCPDICYVMGSTLEQVRRQLLERGLMDQVVILSVSFDPVRDDVAALQEYADRYGASGDCWNVAVVPDEAGLALLLGAFDVTVVPTPDGGFEHNGAIHLVDRNGRLARILDFNSASAVVRAVEASL